MNNLYLFLIVLVHYTIGQINHSSRTNVRNIPIIVIHFSGLPGDGGKTVDRKCSRSNLYSV